MCNRFVTRFWLPKANLKNDFIEDKRLKKLCKLIEPIEILILFWFSFSIFESAVLEGILSHQLVIFNELIRRSCLKKS